MDADRWSGPGVDVMRRRGLAATDHEHPADDAPCCAVCRTASPPCDCEWEDARQLEEQMRTLGRNLREAAGCAMGFDFGINSHGGPGWWPNCDGKPAPGWER